MKKIFLLAKNYFQVSIAFPFSIFIWILITFIEPIVMLTIWQQVAKSGGVLPFSLSQIVTYYILSTLYFRIMQVWSLGRLSKEVYRGGFSHLLLLPIYYLYIDLAHCLGVKITRLIIIIPVFLAVLVIYKNDFIIDLSVSKFCLVIISLILGFFLQFIMENIIALLVFWLERLEKIVDLYFFFSSVLSGALIPLAFFPSYISNILRILPYRYFLSFPLEITLGILSNMEILQGFIVETIWLILFFILYLYFYPKALRKYSAVGQ